MSTLTAFALATDHSRFGHPENLKRIQVIQQLLDEKNVLASVEKIDEAPVDEEQVLRVHSRTLVEQVRRACQNQVSNLDADTYITPASYELALTAVGAACSAAEAIAISSGKNGIALVRPPGHHAEMGRVGGFCLFNNVAAAARHLQAKCGLSRIMIVDLDVHHGNGTQDIFYRDPSVLFVSIHLYHRFFYPGTGSLHETGEKEGLGTTVNVPFSPGAGDGSYATALSEIVAPIARNFQPQFIIVSAGYDAHWADPLAAANLTLNGYATMTRDLISIADTLCGGRILFVLEGGYHPEALSYGVLNTIYALTGRDLISDPLGPSPEPERDMTAIISGARRVHLLS